MMATDNYIEKYLPFQIQNMIGESLKPIIEHLDLNVLDKLYEGVDDINRPNGFHPTFKKAENKIFKQMHKITMND